MVKLLKVQNKSILTGWGCISQLWGTDFSSELTVTP